MYKKWLTLALVGLLSMSMVISPVVEAGSKTTAKKTPKKTVVPKKTSTPKKTAAPKATSTPKINTSKSSTNSNSNNPFGGDDDTSGDYSNPFGSGGNANNPGVVKGYEKQVYDISNLTFYCQKSEVTNVTGWSCNKAGEKKSHLKVTGTEDFIVSEDHDKMKEFTEFYDTVNNLFLGVKCNGSQRCLATGKFPIPLTINPNYSTKTPLKDLPDGTYKVHITKFSVVRNDPLFAKMVETNVLSYNDVGQYINNEGITGYLIEIAANITINQKPMIAYGHRLLFIKKEGDDILQTTWTSENVCVVNPDNHRMAYQSCVTPPYYSMSRGDILSFPGGRDPINTMKYVMCGIPVANIKYQFIGNLDQYGPIVVSSLLN